MLIKKSLVSKHASLHLGLVTLLTVSVLLTADTVLAAERKPLRWYGYGYYGKMTRDDFTDFFMHPGSVELVDSKLIAIGGGKELYHYHDYVTLEGEGQIAHHLGEINDHTEFNALANIRWHPFPWDHWLDTSLAWGLGLSFATETPELERRESDDACQCLLFMNLEIDVMLPRQQDWSVFSRIHHRSGAFGLISDSDAAGDAAVIGIKKRF